MTVLTPLQAKNAGRETIKRHVAVVSVSLEIAVVAFAIGR